MNAVWSAGLQRKPPVFLGRVSGRRCLLGLGAGKGGLAQSWPGGGPTVGRWECPGPGRQEVAAFALGGPSVWDVLVSCCLRFCPEWLVLAWGAAFLQFPFHLRPALPWSLPHTLYWVQSNSWDALVPYLGSLQSGWLGLSRPKQDPCGPWALCLSLRHCLALNPLCGVYHRPQEL